MVLILVVGDLHIPHRAASIPAQFREMFQPGRINTVFITGNCNDKATYDYFRTVANDVQCTRGEYDDWNKNLPDTIVVEVEDLKIGMIHGHQVVPWGDKDSLAMWQRKLDVDVLVSGATHVNKMFEFDGHLFINPGTITGAYNPFECEVPATFVLMEIKESTVTVFSYQYVGEGQEFKMRKKVWTKGTS
jgi:vacuolar protein sorting-associated protein 29